MHTKNVINIWTTPMQAVAFEGGKPKKQLPSLPHKTHKQNQPTNKKIQKTTSATKQNQNQIKCNSNVCGFKLLISVAE